VASGGEMMSQRRRNDSTASCSVGSDDHDAAPPPVDYYRDVWEEFACNGRDADLEPPSPDDDDGRAVRDAQAWWTCQQQQQQPSHADFYSGQQARQWRRQGGKEGEASPPLWVDVQKLCNMCVLSLLWNFFVSHDKYIARPSSKEPS